MTELTADDVKKFEDERRSHWDSMDEWWKEFWRREKAETARRDVFRDRFGLNKTDSIEFQIAEWKRKNENSSVR